MNTDTTKLVLCAIYREWGEDDDGWDFYSFDPASIDLQSGPLFEREGVENVNLSYYQGRNVAEQYFEDGQWNPFEYRTVEALDPYDCRQGIEDGTVTHDEILVDFEDGKFVLRPFWRVD
jgi:hypothetical protein